MFHGDWNHTLVFPEITGEGQGFASVLEKHEAAHSSTYDVFSIWSLCFRRGARIISSPYALCYTCT